MVEAVRELHEVDARLRLGLRADLTDDLVEVAARAVLEDEINVPLGRLDLVQPHHVRVLHAARRTRLSDLSRKNLRLSFWLSLAVKFGLSSWPCVLGKVGRQGMWGRARAA